MKLSVSFEHLLYVDNIDHVKPSIPTRQLGMRSREGQARRLAELYSLHAPSLGRLAYLLVGDAHLSEDLVNEAFIRVSGHLWKLRDPRATESYLRRTVTNLAHAHHRRRRREERSNLLVRSGEPEVSEIPSTDYIERNKLIQSLNQLPYRQKSALVLRYYEDLSEHQVAETLGIPVGTVKTLVFRAKKVLRTSLGDSDEG